jgi:hypothetical protein
MKQRIVLVMLATMTCVSSSFAGLLNVTLTFPKISYNNAGVSALNYNASNQLFSISATPTFVTFANAESPKIISGTKSLQIRIMVDNTGALVGGVPGNDFSLSGTVTEGTNTYSGVLLTGEVTGFGFLESGGTDLYDLQFTPTGGALAGLICGDIGVQVTSGASTFNNDFTTNFNGQAKGTVGAMDHTPPAIICPNNITAECHYTNGLAGAYVSYPTPVVTDNCDPNPTIVCTPPSGSFFALPPPPADSSNYVVTCVVTDAAGNSNACTFTITVEDTLPPEFADANNPVISCSLCVPMILTNDPGACYATLTFPIPVAVDFCCPLLISTTVSAVDENGAVINLTDLGNGMMQGQFPVGTNVNLVTTTANDGRGNSVQHLCAVVVMDSEPPVINCPTNQVVECTGGQIFFEEPVAVDNCPNATYSCTPTNGSVLGIGSHLIVSTVVDCSGNTNQCTFYVTVQDTTPPVISCPTNVTVECGQSTDPGSTGVATASDTCDSSPTVTFTDAVSGNYPQTISRTWTATDSSGNSNSCVQIITIQDTTPPVITCPPDKQLQCGDSAAPANTGTATAADSCSGNVAITFTDVATPANCTGNAGIDRTWKAADASGNSSTCVQHITFVDTTAPTITAVPAGSDLGCNPATLPTDASVKALVTATDNCGTPTVNVVYADVTTGCTVTRTFTVTATDACGNAATPQTVVYTWTADTTPPVISGVPTGSNLGCNPATLPTDASIKALVTATDNSGSATINVTHVDGGTVIAPTRTFTITATDACGNVATASPVVYTWTADTTPPVISGVPTGSNLGCNPATLPTDASIKALVTATDNSGSATINVTHVDGGTAIAPTRTFTITATDACDNVATATVVYTWTADTTAPVLSGVPTGSNLGCNPATLPTDASVKALVTATDNSGSATINVTHVDGGTAIAPTRTFTITATDACGNVATASPVVYTWIVDTTPPVLSGVPTGSNLGCNPATLPTDASIKALVTATDNSGSATINVTHVDGGTAIAPTRTFTITATDGCGNVATASPVIYTWTADTTPPVISGVPTGSNLGCNPATLPTDASVKALVTATDNSGSATINVTHVDVNATNGCMVTRTFTVTATDGCGNTSAPQTVVYSWKSDTVAPILYGCTNQVVYEQVTVTTNRHCIPGGFNYYPICSNHWVWFNCVLTPCPGITNKTYTVCITGQTITGDIGGSNISLTVPDAQITYSSTCTNSTTTFSNNTWVTTCPLGSILTGDQFGSGLAYKMPFASGGGGNLTWSCNFSVPSSVPVNWKWGACVYTNLSNTYTNLGVKPVDDSTKCGYKNSDVACTPENYKQCLTPGARCGDFNHHCGNRTCPWVCNRGTNTVCSGGVVQYVPPTATDTCGGVPNIICSPLPGVVNFIAGSTNVTCTAVDDCGNVSSCTFTVTLLPPPPTITGPGNITTNTTSTSCSQVVKWTVTSSSPCGTPTTTCTPASGSTFSKGTTPVTCTAVVAGGGSNSCSFNVTVNDTTKPTITCPANITTNACSAVVTFAPTVTDNCPGVTYSCTPASGSVFAQGTNTVTCTATDTSGNTASASFKVIVTATAPGAPCSPKATAGTKQVVLTWTASSGTAPITYTVYRSTNLLGVGGYTSIASGITSLTYTNTGLTTGTTYYYYITATNCKGTSSNSSTVSAKSN